MQNNPAVNQTAVKAALVQMTATVGWGYVKQLSNNLVQRAVVDALEEEDAAKRDGKVMKAAALRKGFQDWFIAIEAYKQYTEEPSEALAELALGEETAYAD